MAAAAAITARVAKGYAKAGSKLGEMHDIYRPATTGPALAPENLMGPVPFIGSATANGAFQRPGNWTAPEYFALTDTRLVRPGDYLSGPTGIWYLGTAESLAIPVAIECNDLVTIRRSGGIQPGLNTIYGGRLEATDTALVTEWPASMLGGGHSEAGRAMLPGDPKRFSGAICKIPAFPGVVYRSGDRVESQNGDVWIVAGAFLQSLGWRLGLAGAET